MGKPEAYVENYLRKQAKKYNCLCYKFTSPSTRGVPDDLLIYKGNTYFVETKSAVGSLAAIQKLRIKEMKEHGACVAICHTRKEIDKFLMSFIPEYEPSKNQSTQHQTSDYQKIAKAYKLANRIAHSSKGAINDNDT